MLDQQRINELQESTGHSVFSPSSMKRIILCPGSVITELRSPIPKESIYAAKGTLLHGYCEKAFTKEPNNPAMYVSSQAWDNEDKVLVIEAINYVLQIKAKHIGPVRITFEAKGTLAAWGLPEIYGTMDVQILSQHRVDVLDYKFGYGIQVFAPQNPQCACYLGGSVAYNGGSRPDAELHVHIVQPTLNHYDDWQVDWEDLCSILLHDIGGALKLAKSIDPPFEPSMEACRWCNGKLICDVRKQKVRTQAHEVIKASKSPDSVTKTHWKVILDAADDLQQVIKDVRIYAQAEIRSGRGFPGYKLIAGRSKRVFKDAFIGEQFIKDQLGDAAYKLPELISLAQAEKKKPGLKKNEDWKDLITKPTGKPVLVAESDKREALEFNTASQFTDDAAKIIEVADSSSFLSNG